MIVIMVTCRIYFGNAATATTKGPVQIRILMKGNKTLEMKLTSVKVRGSLISILYIMYISLAVHNFHVADISMKLPYHQTRAFISLCPLSTPTGF